MPRQRNEPRQTPTPRCLALAPKLLHCRYKRKSVTMGRAVPLVPSPAARQPQSTLAKHERDLTSQQAHIRDLAQQLATASGAVEAAESEAARVTEAMQTATSRHANALQAAHKAVAEAADAAAAKAAEEQAAMADAHAAELAALKAGAARAAASSADELRACHVALSEARAECGRLAGDLRAAQSRVEALEGTRSASAKELRDVRDELARTKEEIMRLRVAGDTAVAEAKRDAEAHVRNEVPVMCASHLLLQLTRDDNAMCVFVWFLAAASTRRAAPS